jgi:catechol 2,3-dioxygenase-like lactoylglutathione lyase family enzyme
MIQGIHHVQLAMPAGQESAAEGFYAGLLGIPRVPKPANLESRGGCWFRSDSVEIHLGVEEPFAPARKAHPALLVDDLDLLRQHLAEAGWPTSVDEPLDGYDRSYTNDPFGNRIELIGHSALR